MPEEKSQQSEALTKEDLRFAKERIKSLLAGHKKVWAAQGVSPVISALVSLTDKLALARDNNGETKPGWLYTFLTSSVLSGASAELVPLDAVIFVDAEGKLKGEDGHFDYAKAREYVANALSCPALQS